jgi:DinB superfamily
MVSRAQVVEAIEQGTAQVRHTFRSLTDEQLQTTVHAAERGWTAKEVLAHLATRRVVNDRLLQMAGGDSPLQSRPADWDRWNQALVDQHTSLSRDALLAEFQTVQDDLVAKVRALPEAMLARPIPLPQGEMQLGELLAMAGGAHALHHAEEVAQAIAGMARSTARGEAS